MPRLPLAPCQIAASEDGCYPTEIHVLRIGDVAVCTNQFELFTEYGLRILARSPAHLTFVVQLVGPAYYLPTAEAVRGGGYSAIPESCAVGPEGGDALVDATVERIGGMGNVEIEEGKDDVYRDKPEGLPYRRVGGLCTLGDRRNCDLR